MWSQPFFRIELHYFGTNEVSIMKSCQGLHEYTKETKKKFKILNHKSANVRKAIMEADEEIAKMFLWWGLMCINLIWPNLFRNVERKYYGL